MKQKRTIIKLLDRAAVQFSEYTYLNRKENTGWKSFTYKETRELSLHLAQALLDRGVGKGSKGAILSEGSPNWVLSELALISIGAMSVPLSVKLLPEELPFRINHSESSLIFVSANHLDKVLQVRSSFENSGIKLVYLDSDMENFRKKTTAAGISPDHAWSLEELIVEGKNSFEKDPTPLMKVREEIEENDVVNISYTSGTTGNPKGIMLTHLNYCSNATDGVEMFKIKVGFKTLVILPVDHSFAHTVALYGAMINALELYFLDTRGGLTAALKNIPLNLKEVNPGFLLTVPALSGNFMNKMKEAIAEKGGIVQSIFDSGLRSAKVIKGDGCHRGSLLQLLIHYPSYWVANKMIFPKLREVFGSEIAYLVGGGALLDIKQQEFYYAIGAPVYQGYGLSEASPIISANTPHMHKLGTSGKVLPSVTCRIMKSATEEAALGERGEIVIKGDNVMKGYFKNEEATKECIKDGWLWTGDLGYMDQDGFLVVTGRDKALLIAEDGEKYSPESIEEAIINASPLVEQAMVYNDHRKFTTAVVTLNQAVLKKQFQDLDSAELMVEINKAIRSFEQDEAYKNQFPAKWLPKKFFVAPELFSESNKMLNSTMKMVRYKVTETYAEEIDAMYMDSDWEQINRRNIAQLMHGEVLA